MKGLIFFLSIFGAVQTMYAQDFYKFYYIAIGSGHYQHNPDSFPYKDFIPYENVYGAPTSVSIMQTILDKYVKAKGIAIASTENNMITKEKVFTSLNKLDLLIKQDKASKPFVIFYYCGHGKSENMTWSEYLLPGNCNISEATTVDDSVRSQIEDKFKRGLKANVIIMDQIIKRFEEKKYEYLFLADCCRGEASKDSVSKPFYKSIDQAFDANMDMEKLKALGITSEQMEKSKSDFLAQMRSYMNDKKQANEFHQSNPVVFAAPTNKEALVVPIPPTSFIRLADLENNEIGPLCRRILITVDAFYRSHSPQITIHDLVTQLTNEDLDKHSQNAVSNYSDETQHAKQLVFIKR